MEVTGSSETLVHFTRLWCHVPKGSCLRVHCCSWPHLTEKESYHTFKILCAESHFIVAHILIDSVLTVFSLGKPQQNNNYINISTNILETCGYYFCPDSVVTAENHNLERPADEKMYIVRGVCLHAWHLLHSSLYLELLHWKGKFEKFTFSFISISDISFTWSLRKMKKEEEGGGWQRWQQMQFVVRRFISKFLLKM